VFVVRGTKKFLDRVTSAPAASIERSSTALGDWYATVLFWKPQVALFVSETTLLPVLVPFAPAVSVIDRFVDTLASVLGADNVANNFRALEIAEMREHGVAKTVNRSVVGVMNEFTYLSDAYRASDGVDDLISLSLWLARTCRVSKVDRHAATSSYSWMRPPRTSRR
jgi:hypothetical protein